MLHQEDSRVRNTHSTDRSRGAENWDFGSDFGSILKNFLNFFFTTFRPFLVTMRSLHMGQKTLINKGFLRFHHLEHIEWRKPGCDTPSSKSQNMLEKIRVNCHALP